MEGFWWIGGERARLTSAAHDARPTLSRIINDCMCAELIEFRLIQCDSNRVGDPRLG